MRFIFPELEDGGSHDDFQGIIRRMVKAGWLKAAAESSTGVAVHFSDLGCSKVSEMARIVRPLSEWLRSQSGPKPSLEFQLACMAELSPFLRELMPPPMDEPEIMKLVGFVAVLAPK